jgi:hypothetical protein
MDSRPPGHWRAEGAGTRISDGVGVVLSNNCGGGRTKVLVIFFFKAMVHIGHGVALTNTPTSS